MSSVLDGIVTRTLEDLELRLRAGLSLPARASPPRGFRSALVEAARPRADGRPGLALIAEVKPRSPSKGELRRLDALGPVVDAYRRRADAVSVLVDGPSFGGSLELLGRVRAEVGRPVLAKGFFLHPHQLAEVHAHGADAVLLIARLLTGDALARRLAEAEALGLDALVEVHAEGELERALAAGARVVGVNARDLGSLALDLEGARARLERIPPGVVRVAESGLETRADVERVRGLAQAALIGTAFMGAEDVDAAMEALGW